ncbi:lipid A biosynthesis acyltransferase [Flavobacteriaceae bacterium F89]|uniref:Lipid A biosynthesis acyltransferase n=1 Tax=Cerina litoralis TaxID=2874477 RepID=A0AAE3ETK2_9FLAO|nr:lipid A biosynthesis acyltransferase [Cerina litoralis]MCG2460188.1 lipid A biosynthesis acyltransferase [Cerina litoralis]
MAGEWEGKSRGTVLGYRIFVFCIKKFGIRAAYILLYFVAFYFCFFSKTGTRSIYYYFRKRRGFSALKSVLSIYRSYYTFGQTIIDKVAISSGLRDRFTYDFDGVDNLGQVLAEKKGGLLISAHVGNFEIAHFFLNELEENAPINLLTTDREHGAIKDYLDRISSKPQIKFILYREDFTHIFEIGAALSRNELICITGDRYAKQTKFLEANLLGKTAKFPVGPFLMGQKLKVPILFVYVMKEKNLHYHLYARKVEAEDQNAKSVLAHYVESITWVLDKYPYQWFNYFDFWDTQKN